MNIIFQLSRTDDYLDIGAEVVVETEENDEDIEAEVLIETEPNELNAVNVGEDPTADKWISWVNDKPRKIRNPIYVYPWDPAWDPLGSLHHDDHAYVQKNIGKQLLALEWENKEQKLQFQAEKEKFEAEKRELKFENYKMKKQLEKAHKDLKNLQDTTTTKGKKHMEDMVRLRLKDHFSEATLDLILDKNRQYSKKWTNKDFCFAMLLKMISPKALKLLRKSGMLPLPANSTIKRKFSFMHVTPGIYKNFDLTYILITSFRV
jgi:hypothetical protein